MHSIQAHSTLGSSHVESHCEAVRGVVVHHPLSLPLSVSLTVLQATAILWIQSGNTVSAGSSGMSHSIRYIHHFSASCHTIYKISLTQKSYPEVLFSKMHVQVNSEDENAWKEILVQSILFLVPTLCWSLKALSRKHQACVSSLPTHNYLVLRPILIKWWYSWKCVEEKCEYIVQNCHEHCWAGFKKKITFPVLNHWKLSNFYKPFPTSSC